MMIFFSIICGLIFGSFMLAFTFSSMFEDTEDLKDCVMFWITSDCIAFSSVGYWEELFAELKLGIWILCGVVGGGAFTSFIVTLIS